jgi:hypothetical protein
MRHAAKKQTVGVQFLMDEVAILDLVAARLNKACPKRSDAVRHLVEVGLLHSPHSDQNRPSVAEIPASMGVNKSTVTHGRKSVKVEK